MSSDTNVSKESYLFSNGLKIRIKFREIIFNKTDKISSSILQVQVILIKNDESYQDDFY